MATLLIPRRTMLMAALGLGTAFGCLDAQSPLFGGGERLVYSVRSSRWSHVGSAVMQLSGPEEVRGTAVLVASFATRVGVAFFKGGSESRSWIDADRMTSLRFAKRERRPFATSYDSVEIYIDRGRWTSASGDSGATTSSAPLDELSFIYFLRTLHLLPDTVYSYDRFYDARRIPTTVRVIAHDTLRTPAGTFSTLLIEMRVKDKGHYNGEGLVRLWLSEGCGHYPVRIESDMPFLGTGVMLLESVASPVCPNNALP